MVEAAVPRELLLRAELRRVDEERQNDDVALGSRRSNQGQVSVVQGAHRGDEPDAPGWIDRRAHLLDSAQRAHLAVASAKMS